MSLRSAVCVGSSQRIRKAGQCKKEGKPKPSRGRQPGAHGPETISALIQHVSSRAHAGCWGHRSTEHPSLCLLSQSSHHEDTLPSEAEEKAWSIQFRITPNLVRLPGTDHSAPHFALKAESGYLKDAAALRRDHGLCYL